jgi:hypothetical protein
MKQENYTIPVVCSTNPKDWYIYFEFIHNGVKHKCKKREGINLIKDKRERRREANALAEARRLWLVAGWNPVTDPKFHLQGLKAKTNDMPINEALEWAFSNKKLKKKSVQGYRSMLNCIKDTCDKTGHSFLQISQVDRSASAATVSGNIFSCWKRIQII